MPLEYFIVGASVVLVLSFAALAVLWPTPRWQTPPTGRPLRGGWLGAIWVITGGIGLMALLLVVVSGLVGIDNPARNPAPVIVFVGFWLVIPFLSALIGDVYGFFDPWRRLARGFRLGSNPGSGSVGRVGYLPAVTVFLGFTWLELVSPDPGPRNLSIAALVYTVYLLGASEWFGREASVTRFDGFAVYNRVLGGMGPFDFSHNPPRWRGWLRGLPGLPEGPGMTLLVVAMIGTVTFDGTSATTWWEDSVVARVFTPLTYDLGWSTTTTSVLAGTVGLLGITAVVGVAYLAASTVAARVAGGTANGWSVVNRFAHTLVPIAFAYAFAHYFTLVVFEGQYLLSAISDPFGRGWNLFGTAGREVDFTLISPVAVWWIQVATLVAGHVAGVVLAHDRALADFPGRTAVRSQYAMLGLMVLLTCLGLTILAAG